MIKLYDGGVFLREGTEIVPEAEAAVRGISKTSDEARRETIAYSILQAHNTSGDPSALKIRFDAMASHDITRKALESPKFANGEDYAVQQGAGMVVTKASDAEIQASLVFLKWFTSPEHNITFSVDSGYLPVTHEGNSIDTIRASGLALSDEMDEVLSAAVDTVNENHLYTPRAFSGGTNARAILEYSMSDKASADRAAVKETMVQGQSFEEASAQFLSDECFEAWYQDTLASLEAFQG